MQSAFLKLVRLELKLLAFLFLFSFLFRFLCSKLELRTEF